MPAWMWGATGGVVLSILIGLSWTAGGAGVALLVPVFAIVLAPAGAVVATLARRLWRRQRSPRRS